MIFPISIFFTVMTEFSESLTVTLHDLIVAANIITIYKL